MRMGNERTCMISDSDLNECEMVEEYEDDQRSEGIGGDFQELDEALPIHENLREDIKQAAALYPNCEEELGIPAAQIEDSEKCLKDVTAVRLTFSLSDIPEHLQQLWNLDHCVALEMDIDNVHRAQFRAHESTLAVSVKEKCGTGATTCAYQLSNLASKLIAESYKLPTNESPSTAGSFFAKLYSTIKERLPRMSEFCLACGEKLDIPGVLPSICDGALCNYQSSNFGFFYGLMMPRVSPEVLSLLLHAFGAANVSYRREDIMTPSPPIRNFERLSQLAGKQEEVENADDYEFDITEMSVYTSILQSLQCPKQIMASEDTYKEFKRECPVVAEFISWLVVSNQSYLERVPPSMKVDFLFTNYQYLFVSDTPSKQEQFDKLVLENGGKTRFFFHGSPIENWHSIIRSGLRKLSGTKLMTFGAAYGEGIYLTPSLQYALCYAGGYSMGKFSRKDCLRNNCCELESESDFCCVALVEVVDSAEAYSRKTETIFVSDEQWCSIRMLLLYRKEDIEKLYETERKWYDEEQEKLAEAAAAEDAAVAAAAANAVRELEDAEAPDALLKELSQHQISTESDAAAAAATSQPAADAATSQPAAASANSQPAAAAANSQPAAAAATSQPAAAAANSQLAVATATSQPAAAAATSQTAAADVNSQPAAAAATSQPVAAAATSQPAAAAATSQPAAGSANSQPAAAAADRMEEQHDTAGPSRKETNDKRGMDDAGENQESKKFKKDEEESPSPAAAIRYVPSRPTIGYPRSSQAARIWRRLFALSGGVSTLEQHVPGELTVITDEQREQINRVVRMFRNGAMNDELREMEEKEE